MAKSFYSTAIRFPFCMIKPQPLILSLTDFTACGIPLMLLRTVQRSKSDHHEDFQTKQDSRKKKSYTHVWVSFLFACLFVCQIMYHSSTRFDPAPMFAGINLNFMHTAILCNGLFPRVNFKFCRLCRNNYLNVSALKCYHIFESWLLSVSEAHR